jgi:hypothetical protein
MSGDGGIGGGGNGSGESGGGASVARDSRICPSPPASVASTTDWFPSFRHQSGESGHPLVARFQTHPPRPPSEAHSPLPREVELPTRVVLLPVDLAPLAHQDVHHPHRKLHARRPAGRSPPSLSCSASRASSAPASRNSSSPHKAPGVRDRLAVTTRHAKSFEEHLLGCLRVEVVDREGRQLVDVSTLARARVSPGLLSDPEIVLRRRHQVCMPAAAANVWRSASEQPKEKMTRVVRGLQHAQLRLNVHIDRGVRGCGRRGRRC